MRGMMKKWKNGDEIGSQGKQVFFRVDMGRINPRQQNLNAGLPLALKKKNLSLLNATA